MRSRTLVLIAFAFFLLGAVSAVSQEVMPPASTSPPIYFSDCRESPGTVWEYRPSTATKTALYTRSAGYMSGFAFAPWDPERLYFTNANKNEVLAVSLGGPPTEEVIYTHGTYVRDVAFDGDYHLYFSEATGGGADGKIYRLEADGTASLFMAVPLSAIGGTWAGDFGFAPDGTLLLSSGNVSGAGFYEADPSTGTLTKLYQRSGESLTGFAFDADQALYITNHKTRIDFLDVGAGTTSVAYDDPSQEWICDVGFRPEKPSGPMVKGLWVMPQAIRNTLLYRVKPTGLVDYTDGASGIAMVDAPFGGTLAFVLNSANAIPTPDVYYYRFQYRRQGAPTWNDFTVPISVHYVRYRPGLTPIFPTLSLGPVDKDGKNLYRFRPHEPELQAIVGSMDAEWPKIPFGGDVYRGYLDTLPLAPGPYEIRLEVYNQAGMLTAPGAVFQMIVPTGVGSGGTILTAPAPISGGGTEFLVHVDNRVASAEIKPPRIGKNVTDACGFVRYDPMNPGDVWLGWHAWHEGQFAVYRLNVVKGASGIGTLPLSGGGSVPLPIQEEVASAAHNPSGMGDFFELSPTLGLLDGCVEAAFATTLHVYAKATTGNGYRITTYDADDVRAFAIAPP